MDDALPLVSQDDGVTKTVYVGNLSPETTEEELKSYFAERCGQAPIAPMAAYGCLCTKNLGDCGCLAAALCAAPTSPAMLHSLGLMGYHHHHEKKSKWKTADWFEGFQTAGDFALNIIRWTMFVTWNSHQYFLDYFETTQFLTVVAKFVTCVICTTKFLSPW